MMKLWCLIDLNSDDDEIDKCATYYHHMIFATTMNITSDLLLISILILLIIKVNLPVKRKVILVCILCLGGFNVGDNA